MSGLEQWLPFFEEASPKRDADSWWKQLESKVVCLGLSVQSLVSDRAKALVKLGHAEYFDVVSMPDLFHFVQDISRSVGCRIGLKKKQLAKKLSKSDSVDQQAALTKELTQMSENQSAYRTQIEQINKTVHPFNASDQWEQAAEVEKGLSACFTKIRRIAETLQIQIKLKKVNKVLTQIPDIAAGVQAWVVVTQQEIKQWSLKQSIPVWQQQWFEQRVLPYTYWQLQLHKTQAKARDVELRAYYQGRADFAQKRYQEHPFTRELDPQRAQRYLDKAFRMAATFQRASSQVEGRNGYLAFVHHAHKGIPKQRLEVLTVVHNFDIRRKDGTTPAQRLFQKPFPDLFEFLCLNVQGFKEPRNRKAKSLTTTYVQH